MLVGLARFDLRIPGCGSLKEKRHVVKGLTAGIRQKFNVSVAEVEHQDLWQRARVAVVSVNTDHGHLDSTLSAVAAEAHHSRDIEVLDTQTELWN